MSSEISIKQLPQITEINNDDLILVQTENSTNTLKFSNFIVGLENTTFETTINNNRTDVNTLSTSSSNNRTDVNTLSTLTTSISSIWSPNTAATAVSNANALTAASHHIPIKIGSTTYVLFASSYS